MKITNVIATKERCATLKIHSKTSKNVTINQILKLEYKDKSHFFEVITVSIGDTIDTLKLEAIEVGAYYNLFLNDKDFDIREIYNKLIYVIEDILENEELLKNIAKARCMC